MRECPSSCWQNYFRLQNLYHSEAFEHSNVFMIWHAKSSSRFPFQLSFWEHQKQDLEPPLFFLATVYTVKKWHWKFARFAHKYIGEIPFNLKGGGFIGDFFSSVGKFDWNKISVSGMGRNKYSSTLCLKKYSFCRKKNNVTKFFSAALWSEKKNLTQKKNHNPRPPSL